MDFGPCRGGLEIIFSVILLVNSVFPEEWVRIYVDNVEVVSVPQPVPQLRTVLSLHSINQSINQSSNQIVSQSINHSVSPSINQSVSQSINQSFSKSFDQSVNLSVNQIISQTFWRLCLFDYLSVIVFIRHKLIKFTWFSKILIIWPNVYLT